MSNLTAGTRPTNWEHHLYHSKVDEDLSHDRQRDTHKQISLIGTTVRLPYPDLQMLRV